MNRRGRIIGGAGIAILILLGITAWEVLMAHRTEAVVATASLEEIELRRKIALAHERSAAAEAEARHLRDMSHTEHSQAAPVPEKGSVKGVDPKMAAALEAIAKTPWRDLVLAKSPELQARYLAVRRTDLASLYGPFFANAKFVPDQIARLQEIMNAAEERALDLKSVLRVNGWNDSDPAVATLRNQSDETLHTAERELLGPDSYQQLSEYERALPARTFVGNLATSSVFAGEPLSSAQVNQLTQILSEGNAVYRSGGSAAGPLPDFTPIILARQPAQEPIDSDQILARARLVLSPSQYIPFEAEIERPRTIVKLYNLMLQTPGDEFAGFTIVARK